MDTGAEARYHLRWGTSPDLAVDFPALKTTMRFFGLQRSGNHAVISWILNNAPEGPTLFFNNGNPHKCPFATFATAEYEGQKILGKAVEEGEEAAVMAEARSSRFVLMSYEHGFEEFVRGKPTKFVTGTDIHADFDILVKRSFLNWLASLWKLQTRKFPDAEIRYKKTKETIEAWVALFGPNANLPASVVTVDFDTWNSDADYRAALAPRLGLVDRDLSLPKLSKYGGGSSFDGNNPNIVDPNEMALNERWKTQLGDEDFTNLLRLVFTEPTIADAVKASQPGDADILRDAFGVAI